MTLESDNQYEQNRVAQDLRNQPHLLMQLAGNALTVAENLRDNYFRNTTKFIAHLRGRVYGVRGEQAPLIKVADANDLRWEDIKGEKVTFIDGGVGRVELASQIPILLRVGSYTVRPGERRLSEREHFGYYPVLLGDIEGGSKERRDFPDIVRIISELLGGLAVLDNNPDIDVLMFHGPLMYLMNAYAGHTPFTEKDIDLLLANYAPNAESAKTIKEDFLAEARQKIYPQMLSDPGAWSGRRLFEPLAWIAFLLKRIIKTAKARTPVPIIAGVVERGGNSTEYARKHLLRKSFEGFRQEEGGENYFNKMFGRSDLLNPDALVDRLGYTDALLAAMLLKVGDRTDDWKISKAGGLHKSMMKALIPGEVREGEVDFSALQSDRPFGFPRVSGAYIHVSEAAYPIRVEVFSGLKQMDAAAKRAYLYARLLPQYGFPVGLDIADKYAKIPAWMTSAYAKLIRHHLGVGLQSGDISDKEMRKIIMQAVYMNQRDWIFRPKI